MCASVEWLYQPPCKITRCQLPELCSVECFGLNLALRKAGSPCGIAVKYVEFRGCLLGIRNSSAAARPGGLPRHAKTIQKHTTFVFVVLRTGLPFSVTQNNTINTLEGHVRPDLIGNPKLDNPTVDKWYNPDAYRVVTCAQPGITTGNDPVAVAAGIARNSYLAQFCHYGSAGHAVLEGPGFKNVDFSLLKNIMFKEKVKMQFRTEIFNIFNTPQFGIPANGLNGAPAFLPAAANGAFPTQITASRGPGAITSLVAPMRQMQYGLKLLF